MTFHRAAGSLSARVVTPVMRNAVADMRLHTCASIMSTRKESCTGFYGPALRSIAFQREREMNGVQVSGTQSQVVAVGGHRWFVVAILTSSVCIAAGVHAWLPGSEAACYVLMYTDPAPLIAEQRHGRSCVSSRTLDSHENPRNRPIAAQPLGSSICLSTSTGDSALRGIHPHDRPMHGRSRTSAHERKASRGHRLPG